MEESALTRGGLGIDSFSMRQEVSRGHSTLSNERMNKSEVSQTKEGLNVKWFTIENGLAVKRNSHLQRLQVIKK